MTFGSLSEQRALSLQRRALSLLTDNQPGFTDALIDIYQLRGVDVGALQQQIARLQEVNLYKEVGVEPDPLLSTSRFQS